MPWKCIMAKGLAACSIANDQSKSLCSGIFSNILQQVVLSLKFKALMKQDSEPLKPLPSLMI